MIKHITLFLFLSLVLVIFSNCITSGIKFCESKVAQQIALEKKAEIFSRKQKLSQAIVANKQQYKRLLASGNVSATTLNELELRNIRLTQQLMLVDSDVEMEIENLLHKYRLFYFTTLD